MQPRISADAAGQYDDGGFAKHRLSTQRAKCMAVHVWHDDIGDHETSGACVV
jgi:hypothetical protein